MHLPPMVNSYSIMRSISLVHLYSLRCRLNHQPCFPTSVACLNSPSAIQLQRCILNPGRSLLAKSSKVKTLATSRSHWAGSGEDLQAGLVMVHGTRSPWGWFRIPAGRDWGVGWSGIGNGDADLQVSGSQKQASWFTAHHPNLTSISDSMCS